MGPILKAWWGPVSFLVRDRSAFRFGVAMLVGGCWCNDPVWRGCRDRFSCLLLKTLILTLSGDPEKPGWFSAVDLGIVLLCLPNLRV